MGRMEPQGVGVLARYEDLVLGSGHDLLEVEGHQVIEIKPSAIKVGGIYWQYERINGQVYCVGYRLENGEPVETHAYKYDGVL